MERRVCIVTGASSGIGEATAARLARLGHTVVMACRKVERGRAAAERIRAAGAITGELVPMACDLASLRSVRAFAAEVSDRHPRIDALVQNAGWCPRSERRRKTASSRCSVCRSSGRSS